MFGKRIDTTQGKAVKDRGIEGRVGMQFNHLGGFYGGKKVKLRKRMETPPPSGRVLRETIQQKRIEFGSGGYKGGNQGLKFGEMSFFQGG
jgi:hypothetical protein